MKIEVGEYGRTNWGNIIKFAWIEYSEGKRDESKVLLINNDILSNDFYYFKIGEKIIKHSKNIIDLIEVGDYINGEKVVEIHKDREHPILYLDHWEDYIFNNEIESVVTHEQFANVEYKVKEDK